MTNQIDNRRILIIDDNSAIHDDYRKILAAESNSAELDELGAMVFGDEKADVHSAQFELQSAYQGQEGFEMVRRAMEEKRPFAMAFVDMRMPPGWDGLETIEHIWQVDPHLQIVICTAYSDYTWSEIINRVQHRDRLLILKKPFDNVEVCQLAIALTRKWELERQSKERMRAVVETAADGIITFREDGVIESCNSASCALFRHDQAELIGSRLAELLPGAGGMPWDQYLRERFGVGATATTDAREVDGLRGDGTHVPLLVSLSEFATDDGRMFTAILRDLTEYKRLQNQLVQSQKLESIGQLAAGISHEINTPMQFIGDNMEFLIECVEKLFAVVDAYDRNLDPTSPDLPWKERAEQLAAIKQETRFEGNRQQLVQAIEESLEGARRVIQIVQAMKQFSHLDTKEKVPFDLNDAIRSTITVTKNRWKYFAAMNLELDPELPPLVCVPGEINQVLLNLIVNAADAIAEPVGESGTQRGTITIRTSTDGDNTIIQVEDTGCGIAESIKDRIFDPFFTTKDVGKGSGQGLPICHDIVVNKHQGTIEVESTVGAGSTFTIRLPMLAAAGIGDAAIPELVDVVE